MGFIKNDYVYIISEIGVNHDGSLEKALNMIRKSAEAGVNCAKFQLFSAKKMYHKDAGEYKTASGEIIDIYKVVQDLELPESWIPKLMVECKKNNIDFLCTVCDEGSVDILNKYNPSSYKVASYEISHIPLFKYLGIQNKPIIFSTAGATIGDIEGALEAFGKDDNLVIMHCNAKYPTDRDMINMNCIKTLKLAFPNSIIGFSDHTEDPTEAPVAAVALGAKVIEKHFTLDKTSYGPDHSYAVDPVGLKQMVDDIRITEKNLIDGSHIDISKIILGTSKKTPHKKELELKNFTYRSIYAIKNILEGEVFTSENIGVLRPGKKKSGMHPRFYSDLIENKLKSNENVPVGTPINIGDFHR